MDSKRRNELANHARAYTDEFSNNLGLPDFQKIAESENIVLIFDDYKGAFEGLTVCENGKFYIHIDLEAPELLNTPRKRFTIAHELGHALIAEHRMGLLTNELEPHISEYLLGNQQDEIELEADYFASCLLMPQSHFLSVNNQFEDKFGFEIMGFLSEHFSTSLLATILRYAEIGPIPVFFTFNSDGNIKWYKSGSKFPEWALKFKVGSKVPANTLVADVFEKGFSYIEEIRNEDAEDWFHIYNDDYESFNFYEQCYFLKSYNYIISMLWFAK